MKKILLSLLTYFMTLSIAQCQCYCENCPQPIVPFMTNNATLNISGATNTMLGSNGQELINIGMHFQHQDISEMGARIIAPNGSFVDLMVADGIGFGEVVYFDIDFISCGETPMPDCTNSGVINPEENWSEGPYSGSYLPEFGCLSDLTGPVNGLWTIQLNDNISQDDGDLYCFDLTFADVGGITCNSADCPELFCAVQGGNELTPSAVNAPQGDPSLLIDYQTSFIDCEIENTLPDFSYVYLIFDNGTGTLVEIQSDPVDLTGYAAGSYSVYGFSIYDLDLPIVEGMDFSTTTYFTIESMIIAGNICADFSTFNSIVIIEQACDINLNATLEQEDITAPQNDPALDPDWMITFIDPEPDPALYGFYYLVVNDDNDELIAYYTTDDFTLLLEGNYYVVVIYYLLSDLALLLPPDGVNTFADLVALINNDDLCAQYFGFNTLTITPQCNADAGAFSPLLIEECVGDDALMNTIVPDYSGAFDPGSDYSYSYIVSENGIVIEISDDADFTDLVSGVYEICGFSYITTDAGDIPIPDGSITVADIDQLNMDGTICGDITDDCLTLQLSDPPVLTFTGETSACAGTLYTYTIGNYTGDINDYLITIDMGGFSQLFNDPLTGEVFIDWLSGPGNICLTLEENNCETEVCIVVDVIEEQTVTISGEDEICPGATEIYTVLPIPQTGESYVFNITGGSIVSQTDASVTVLWDITGPFSASAELIGGCGGDETLVVNLVPPVDFPMVTIPDNGCTGSGVAISDISDPLILDWEWTATNAIISFNAGFVNFDWIAAGPAEICLEIETACGMDQMCYDVDVIQSPEPTIDPIIIVCDLTFTLQATPSNGSSWLWTSPGSGGSVSYTDQTNFLTDVTVTSAGTYTFILQEFGAFCGSSVETTVIVEDGLDISNPIYDCAIDGSYTVSFTMLDGIAPYSVDGNMISGNIFVSGPILDGEMYSFMVTDSEGCSADIAGSHSCPCITDAGTMQQDVIAICISSGLEAIAIHNVDETFDIDDQGIYILHTNATNILGTVIAQNTTGVFSFDPMTMIGGEVYYISFVAGDADGASVDLSDPCLSVAIGQPVIFHGDPFIFVGNDDQTCGLIYDLTQNSLPLFGTWSDVSSPIGSDVVFITNNGQTTVVVDQEGSYIFEYSFTGNNGCTGSDQREITFLPIPVVENTELSCDNGQYSVSFDIQGGTSPYLVNGTVVNGNTFTSNPINSGELYSYQITDAEGCTSDISAGTFLCDCDADAGTMEQIELDICAVDGTQISGVFNDDAILEGDDVGMFYLHTGSSNVLGNVLATGNTPDFIYEASYGIGVTIYMSYVVGNDMGGMVDLNDDCLSVSVGQPVNLIGLEKIEIGDYLDLCSFTVDFSFIDLGYSGEWSIISSPQDGIGEFVDISVSNTSFEVDTPGEYIVSWMPTGADCAVGDTTTLTFFPTLQVENIEEVCNDQLTDYNVSFNISGGVSPYYINGVEVANAFVSDLIISGNNYSFNVTDDIGCELVIEGSFECLCDNESGTMAVDTLGGCIDEVLVATYNQDAVFDNDDVGNYIIYEGSSSNVDVIIDMVDEPNLSYTPDFMLGQVYFIAYVIGDEDNSGNVDLLDPCVQISNGQPFVFNGVDEVIAGDDVSVCGFDSQLVGNVFGLDPLWTLINSPVGSNVIFDNSNVNSDVMVDQSGAYSFELSVQGASCPSTDTVVLNFVSTLDYQILEFICDTDGYSVVVEITGGTTPYFIDGIEVMGSTFTSSQISLDTDYAFDLSDSGLCSDITISGESSCDCVGDAGTNDTELISVCSTSDIPLGFLSNLDFVLDSDDVIHWVIHTSSTSELGDVLGVIDYDQNLSIVFDDFNLNYDEVYYVSIVVGNEGAIFNPSLDPCLSVSVGAPFSFEEPIILSSGEDQVFCGPISKLIGTAPDTNTLWKINSLSSTLGWDPDQFEAPIFVFAPGEYSFYLTPLGTECYITDTVYVTSLALAPSAEIDSFATVCNNAIFGSVINLNDQILGGYEEGIWSREGIDIDTILDFDGFEPGEYIVTYSSTSEDCGTLSYDVTITIEDCQCPEVSVDFSDVSCFGFSDGDIILELEEGENLIDYDITVNEEEQNELLLDNLSAGDYSIMIAGIENCNYEYDITINEPRPISVSLGDDINAEVNDSLTIIALTDLALSDIDFILWEDLNGMLDEDDLELITSFDSNDSISIQIEDEAGCIAYDEIRIRVIRDEFIFPNVINSNSQTGNDLLSLKDTRGIDQIKSFSVFDRWGNIMYKVENIDPKSELAGWNGRHGSQEVAVGVYVYNMVVLIGGEEVQLLGDVTVIR